MIPMSWYLILAAALFCTGLFGVLARRNAVGMLMGVELMLNAVNINLLTFWHFQSQTGTGAQLSGLVFTAIVFAVAAAEVAVALALIISAYRRRETVVVDDLTMLQG